MVATDVRCQSTDLIKIGEVGAVPVELVAAGPLADLRQGCPAAGVVAAVQQQGRAGAGKIDGQRPPEPVGGAGDQDGLLGHYAHGEPPDVNDVLGTMCGRGQSR